MGLTDGDVLEKHFPCTLLFESNVLTVQNLQQIRHFYKFAEFTLSQNHNVPRFPRESTEM